MNFTAPPPTATVLPFSMSDIFSPTTHPSPYLLGLVIPLCIIAFITRSLANHQRKRQSSLSLRYDDSEDESEKSPEAEKQALKSQLSELRSVAASQGNPVVAAGPSHTASGKKIWENDAAYVACFPDLSKVARESSEQEVERMKRDKVLYHKLQNLEDHPGQFVAFAIHRRC